MKFRSMIIKDIPLLPDNASADSSQGETEAEHRLNVTMLNSKVNTSSIYSNNANISNVSLFNNEAISVEDITYNLNFYKNLNEKNNIFTSDFETHKAEPEKTTDAFHYKEQSCASTSYVSEEIKVTSEVAHEKTKNAACQTESLPELFEKYSDLNDVISKWHSSKTSDREEFKERKLSSSELIFSERNSGAQGKNTFIKLTGRNLFDSREVSELSYESFNSEKVNHETIPRICESFNNTCESVTQDQEVLSEVYLNKENHNFDGQEEMKGKIKTISKNQRSKVRMGLSRKQRVKPLHPDFKYKEAST
ncbi:uncharacterized protein TNCV_4311091 [Trichonephila clavipes]|nr:uncharacterized protein TNCV_4311091 [Trichonephila clavipes]